MMSKILKFHFPNETSADEFLIWFQKYGAEEFFQYQEAWSKTAMSFDFKQDLPVEDRYEIDVLLIEEDKEVLETSGEFDRLETK